MHLRFFDFFGFIVSQFSFRRQGKRKNLKKINLKNSGEKSVEAGNSKAKTLFDFTEKAAHCQKPNFLNGVESIFMFQRDHTQNCQYFWGEGGETSAKQRFLTQLFSAKSRAEISPDGENRVGRRSEQATDFFKEKIGAATTAKPRRGWGPRKSLLFWGEGGETSAKQTFLAQLFLAKSKAEISPDGENRVGRRPEQ